jgi:hypothetical protein
VLLGVLVSLTLAGPPVTDCERVRCPRIRERPDAAASDDLAQKFKTEKDTPYLRWVRGEGLDILSKAFEISFFASLLQSLLFFLRLILHSTACKPFSCYLQSYL